MSKGTDKFGAVCSNEEQERKRCEKCEYKHLVHTNSGFNFYGCYHRPYKGKRVAEIKDCPKGKGE